MKITIQNKADIPNKYFRFVKFKLYKLQAKFKDIVYTELYVRQEGKSTPMYHATVKIGVPGHDIVINKKSNNLSKLWRSMTESIHRHSRKFKEKNLQIINGKSSLI